MLLQVRIQIFSLKRVSKPCNNSSTDYEKSPSSAEVTNRETQVREGVEPKVTALLSNGEGAITNMLLQWLHTTGLTYI